MNVSVGVWGLVWGLGLPCEGDDVYYVEILALGILEDNQLTVGHFAECSTLFPKLELYLCSSVLKCHPGYC